MRSYFYKTLLLACVAAVNAGAISLYDTAPVVGLPLSHAVKYNVNARVGYDTNMNATSNGVQKGSESASAYVGCGLGASYADYESVDKISYSFNLGATRYLSAADTQGKEMYADCSLSASLVHAFTARSTYMGSLRLGYSPEPDYESGISSARRQGDALNWSLSNSYNHSLDARWSWNVNLGYSGNIYGESAYQSDNRQYINAGCGLNYRASELLSYNAGLSFRHDIREKGYNSDNVTFSVGFSRSLDPVSSCSCRLGLQTKQVAGDVILTPNLNMGYNRQVAEGLSVNSYLSLSNENVDTYRGPNANYLSDVTWRVGVNCSYRLSPDVSFSFGVSMMYSQYTEGTGRLQDEKNATVNPTLGMSYSFRPDLVGSISYQYTWFETNRKGSDGYTRHNVSTGLTYNF